VPETTTNPQSAINTSALSILRQGTAVDRFTPNSGGQNRFFNTKAHEIILSGGNSGGKSYCGVMMCAWHIVPELDKHGKDTGKTIHPHIEMRIPPAGREGWISSHSSETQRDTLRPIIDKILKPYMTRSEEDGGVYLRMFFKGVQDDSWINTKWQTQGPRSYAGPKKVFVFMDEPHSKAIYREIRMRIIRSAGYMWICMTPVIDEESYARSADILWMRDHLVEPWHRNPDDFPLRDIIYINVEENYDYIPGEFVDATLNAMSEQERAVRGRGLFILWSGAKKFNTDMLGKIQAYLEENEDVSTPQYGRIAYSQNETDDMWKAEFVPNDVQDFPDKPQGEWAIKIWEKHVDGTGLQLCPGYLITVDPAEGKPGGDYTSVYVFRKDTKGIVAALHGHLTEEELAKQLWLLGHYYNEGLPDYDPAELAIEAVRGPGGIVQRYLIDGNREMGIPKYPWHRIYQRPTPADLDQKREYPSAPGWDTNARTRKHVVAGAVQAVVLAYRSIHEGLRCKIPDISLIKEAFGFVRDPKSGKFEGHPDDRVISVGIGHVIMGGGEFAYNRMTQTPDVEETSDDYTWFMKENEDTGLLQVQFNYGAIIDKIQNPRTAEINF